MTDGMSSRTCYTKLNFDFPYVTSLSLRRDTYKGGIMNYCCVGSQINCGIIPSFFLNEAFILFDVFALFNHMTPPIIVSQNNHASF